MANPKRSNRKGPSDGSTGNSSRGGARAGGAETCLACGAAVKGESSYCSGCGGLIQPGVSALPLWARLGGPVVLFVLSIIPFTPVWNGEFLNWDDDKNITENFDFRSDTNPSWLSWAWTAGKMGHYQPLSWTTLGIEYNMHGLTLPDYPEAKFFHRTNILLHAAGCAVLFLVMASLLSHAVRSRPQWARDGGGDDATYDAPEPAPVWPGTRGLLLTIAAFAAAAFHAIHPLRCESVCWVTERRDVLSGVFIMLSVWCYLRAAPRRAEWRASALWVGVTCIASLFGVMLLVASISTSNSHNLRFGSGGAFVFVLGVLFFLGACAASLLAARQESFRSRPIWMALCIAFLVISLFAKAWGVALPVLFLVMDVWPLNRLKSKFESGGGGRGRESSRVAGGRGVSPAAALMLVVEKLPMFVLTVVFLILAKWAQAGQLDTMKTLEEHTIFERILQAGYGVCFYPLKTLVPINLIPLYELPFDLTFSDPRFAIGLPLALAMTAFTIIYIRRWPAFFVVWLCYGAMVAPVLGLSQSGPQLVADRYAYLAGIPFAALLGGGLLMLMQRSRLWTMVGIGGSAVVIGTLVGLTSAQSAIWQDSYSLWKHTVEVDPLCRLGTLNYAIKIKNRAEELERSTDDRPAQPAEAVKLYYEAIEYYERGLKLADEKESTRLLSNEANVYSRLAELETQRRDAHRRKAIELSSRAVELAEKTGLIIPEFYLNLGVMQLNAGGLDDAIVSMRKAVSKKRFPKGSSNLAMVLSRKAQRIAQQQPDRALALLVEAIGHAEEAVRLEPGYLPAWRNLINASCERASLMSSRNLPGAAAARNDAVNACRRLLQIEQNDADAKRRIAQLQALPG